MKLKSILALAACAAAFVATAATSTPKGFTDNMDVALAEAKASGKYIYACFSGSDWCGWCKKLESEVFSDKEFDFAGALAKDYVLVFIDSPRDKSLLSEHAKAHNKELAKKYEIQGYPTALILDSKGEKFEETGYRRGGAKKYVEFLMDLRKKDPEAIKAEKAKAKALDEKYFGAIEKQIDQVLRPLNSRKAAPTPEAFTKAADELEKIVKQVEEIKFAPEDAAAMADKQKQMKEGLGRLVPRIRKAAEAMAKKAAKAAEKPAEKKSDK